MTRPVRLAINGASGRMGGALLSLLGGDRRFELVHAVVAPGSSHAGLPVVAGNPTSLRYAQDWTQAPAIDVVVDFSGPAGFTSALDHCLAQGAALISGTTGIDAMLEARLASASKDIAVLRAASFSLGIAMLTRLLHEAAVALPNWDMEIVEAHHGRKLDAPSGTALALGHAAATARGTTLEAASAHDRQGRAGERVDGSIGFAVIRGGDIVGEHTAMLIGQGERLELTHRATDRSVFARGALYAAHWLAGRPPGQWQLDDVIAPLR
jgi:4-hydroxy-tetrahydrodipicolinate reductase